MTDRTRIPTGAPWAGTVGYSRAIRVENRIWVSGTAAVSPDGGIAHPGDAYGQAKLCIAIIADALEEAGAGLEHVVRTRMFIRHTGDWAAVGKAHGEAFAEVRPATTMVVTGFIDDAMLVEIEAEAVV